MCTEPFDRKRSTDAVSVLITAETCTHSNGLNSVTEIACRVYRDAPSRFQQYGRTDTECSEKRNSKVGKDIMEHSVMIEKESHNTVKSVEVAFRIIETLKERGGMGVTELATELDLPKSTTHRYLKTLTESEYLVKDGTTYHIGLRFLGIGEFSRTQRRGFQMVKQKVVKIAEETGEKAQFIVEEYGKAVYVYQEIGDQGVNVGWGVGKRTDLHATSAGKAIMAQWPEERVKTYVDEHGLTELTSYTITDHEELVAELEKTRERGYGINEQEHIDGFTAVGVPVFGSSETVLGSLSVGGPINRMRDEWLEQEVISLLLGMSNELELNLRYS